MNTWPCGTPKSAGNAFSGAALSEREPVKRTGVPPKPKKIHLRGSMVYDSTGKKTVPLAPNQTGTSVSRAHPSPFRKASTHPGVLTDTPTTSGSAA